MYAVAPWLRELVKETGTPHFLYDLHIVREQIDKFHLLLPDFRALYSTKTNSQPAIIDTALYKGMEFDAASLGEIEMLLARGAQPSSILFTHPVKSVAEIKRAYELGVYRFTADCASELDKLHKHAPGAGIFIRLIPSRDASLYNYQHRLGARPKQVDELLKYAAAHRINVCGISFHVGSQSMKASPWNKALREVRKLIERHYDLLPSLRQVNIGSGFPVEYDFGRPPSLETIAAIINQEIAKFPADILFIAEPGRIIVAPAAVLVLSVVENLSRGKTNWLFTDTTVYSGLIEPLESSGVFHYPITSSVTSGTAKLYNIAGKTLDPDDIISTKVQLSGDIKAGDLLFVHKVGAYTAEFFTAYHSLPRPLVSFYDSEHSHNVSIQVSDVSRQGVKAERDIDKGETIFTVTGHRSKERTRTSFQIGPELHVEPTLYGAYLNHSCAPNAGVRTNAAGLLNIIARKPIRAGDEISVDYAMFEYELADMARVPCLCQTPECRGTVLGYRNLSPEKKAEYHDYTASHLLIHERTKAKTTHSTLQAS